jgi:glycosyltransferase EpsF
MKEPKPKVLHIVSALGVGGVEVWLIALLAENRRREQAGLPSEEIHILMTGGSESDLDKVASSLGGKLHYIRFGRKRLRSFAKELRSLLASHRFTAFHDHQDYTSAWHLLAGAGLLPPIRVVHVHNPPFCHRINTGTPLRKAMFQVSSRVVRRLATHVLGTSAQVLDEYGFTSSAFPDQVIRSLHCGFDVASFTGSHGDANASVCAEFRWPAGSRICLFAGRLDGIDPRRPEWNHKNPRFALEVARQAIEQGEDMRLLVAGSGDVMRAQLESEVESWGLSDRIAFAGVRPDIARLMTASHVLLFPSLEEGLGMVAVEAQTAGLRVLASATVPVEAAALSELVSFMPLDAGAQTWAVELRRLLGMPRYESSLAAERMCKTDFSIDRSYQSLHDIYSGATTSSRRQ